MKAKSIFGRVVVFGVVLVCALCPAAFGQPWDGNGVEGDPYQIWTAEDIQAIGADSNYWDAHFELMADIDLGAYTGASFNIIGNYPSNPFTGVFDGDGHVISNFTYDFDRKSQVGLFGYIGDPNAEIRDLGLIDPNINTVRREDVGALVGYLESGTLSICYVEGGSVKGGNRVGGLVGYNEEGNIQGCYSTGSVTGEYRVGGLVGESLPFNSIASISNSYSTGSVTGTENVGGLVGRNLFCNICDSYSIGDVTGESYVGGLIGRSIRGDISDCYKRGTVTGSVRFIGGLVGYGSGGSISNCYSVSTVDGHDYVGGLVGQNTSENHISSCYSEGTVTGDNSVGGLIGEFVKSGMANCYSQSDVIGDSYVGGLVGRNGSTAPYFSIASCYSVGSVTGVDSVGGLIGDGVVDVIDSFWDVNSSGESNSAGGVGKTTVEMQMESTFTDAGWDFVGESSNGTDEIWAIREGTDYPKHVWTGYYGGNGTEVSPYLIYTAGQMNAIGAEPNDWDKHFRLMADIDLGAYTGTSFNIIGVDGNPFTGVFDGNGHTISNFSYSSSGTNHIGVFGVINGESAEIKDLILLDPNVETGTGDYVGSMVGWLANGTLSACGSEAGIVSGAEHVGGLVGRNDGTVTDCYSSSDVAGSGNYDMGVGGLIGSNYLETATVARCYSTGNVTGDKGLGGLVGSNYFGMVTNCYSRGSVWGTQDDIGGLVGYSRGVISKSYSTGDVTGAGWVGGFVGFNGGTILDCVWDRESSGRSNMCEYEWTAVGASGCDDDGGKTTTEMKTESTFTDAGWDFVGEVINGANDIWEICEGTNYPKFVWQIPVGDLVCPDGVNFKDYAYFAERWYETDYGDVNGVELTGDGKVNWEDFGLFAEWWMVSGCGGCGGADFTGEGDVDELDLDVIAGHWLESEYGDCGGAELTGDGMVGADDLREFSEHWLAGM